MHNFHFEFPLVSITKELMTFLDWKPWWNNIVVYENHWPIDVYPNSWVVRINIISIADPTLLHHVIVPRDDQLVHMICSNSRWLDYNRIIQEDFRQRCKNHVERTKSRMCNVHTCGRGDGHMCTLACCKWEWNEHCISAQKLVDVKISLVYTRGCK